jgi:hypothetical protein
MKQGRVASVGVDVLLGNDVEARDAVENSGWEASGGEWGGGGGGGCEVCAGSWCEYIRRRQPGPLINTRYNTSTSPAESTYRLSRGR